MDAQKSEKPEKNRKIFLFECAILVKKKKRKRLGSVPEPLFAWRGRQRVGYPLPHRRPFESASRHITDSYMRKLRDQSNKTRKAAESKAFSNAFVSAQKSGALEVTVNGKTYRRANKRSGTWRPV